jgi:MFS superfamily sulfate permease-like transporter
LLVYAAMGPSRILVLGPDSSLAAIIAATVIPLAAGDRDRAVALAGGLALISGALGSRSASSTWGLLTDLLSKPIRIGYLNGIALTVGRGETAEIVRLFDDVDGVVPEALAFVGGVAGGATNVAALGVGLARSR